MCADREAGMQAGRMEYNMVSIVAMPCTHTVHCACMHAWHGDIYIILYSIVRDVTLPGRQAGEKEGIQYVCIDVMHACAIIP